MSEPDVTFPQGVRPGILIYCADPIGGSAEHTHYQARSLQRAGVGVVVLATPGYLPGRSVTYAVERCLADDVPLTSGSRLRRRLGRAWTLLQNRWRFAAAVRRWRPVLVLDACYTEYLSPLWVWPHLWLARHSLYAANAHDPVRDYQIGPGWWHRLSVAAAYWPLRFVLVHQRLPVPSPVPARVEAFEVPTGVYDLENAPGNPAAIRDEWNLPAGMRVFFAFGFIRDNKNIDLVIRALVENPGACLVVMGGVASTKDRPVAFYRELAEELGVADRVRLIEGFVPNEKLASYFSAADFVVLTYSASFRSQSGVLNVAARARRQVLASSGPSPMADVVCRFRLGAFVAPDSAAALAEGMAALLRGEVAEPEWDAYEAFASWDENARTLIATAARFGHPLLPVSPHA